MAPSHVECGAIPLRSEPEKRRPKIAIARRVEGSPSRASALTWPGEQKSKEWFTAKVAAPPTRWGALKTISHVHVNVHYPIQRPIFDLHQISPKLQGTTPCYLGF